MLIQAGRSCLLIIDVQEKLVPAVHEPQRVIDNCAWLMRLAGDVGVPLLVSQQYPKGLGPTVAPLRDLAPAESLMDKVHFSCVAADNCRGAIEELGRHQVVIAGIEAHVCVLQTAINIVEMGKQVFVVADAIASRDPRNAEVAVERMRQAGAQIVTREMVLFEWAHQAGTDQFRQLSRDYLR